MALWGAPLDDRDHALHAVQAAIAAVHHVETHVESSSQEGTPLFRVKIGLYSGSAVVGNVGTRERLNYTAIGEAVNIASRLEGLTAVYGCRVLIGDATASRVRSHYLLKEIDRVQVKGKSTPVTIFEPLCRLDEATPALHDIAARYEHALERYRARDFAIAAATWLGLASHTDEKSPERTMAERAQRLELEPPPEDWSGVWRMTTK